MSTGRSRRPATRPAAALTAVLALALAAAPAQAQAKKRVACTLATLESLVREIGGDRVEAFSLSAGDQDPHTVSPTPSLMKRVREADALFEIGMQLEPWADEVANGSGNARIFRGAPGRIVLSTGIPKLEIPSTVSRSQGDIHPEGNPHLWLDPVRARMLAENTAAALKVVAPADAVFFDERLRAFQSRLDAALFGEDLLRLVGSRKLRRLALDARLHEFLESNELDGRPLSARAGGWLAKARPLRGQRVVEFHKVWAYFASVFGFRILGTIEEKPGIAPGPRHLSELLDLVRTQGVKLILVDNFYDPALPERIAREGGARAVVLPNQIRGEKGVDDYFALVDRALDDLTRALAAPADLP